MAEEKSNAHPASYYYDPALAYERKEAKTCKGCIFKQMMLMRDYCDKGKKQFPNRCKLYEDRK